MVCFSRLASPSLECILDLLPLVDLLRSVSLCRLFALDQVPAALRRRRHLKLLICPSSPSGLRLWATLPIDPLAIYRIRDIQQRQRQQGDDQDSKPGDDGSIRGPNLLVLSQLTPSTTLGLLEAFPLLVSLTFVQCAVSVATTVQLIVLLKSAWSIRLETVKLYLNQFPELGLVRSDTYHSEDLLLSYEQMYRTHSVDGYSWHRAYNEHCLDRLSYCQTIATVARATLEELPGVFIRMDCTVRPILELLWSLISEGSTPLVRLRRLWLATDVARYAPYGGPPVIHAFRFPRWERHFRRGDFSLRPPATVRQLRLHFEGMDATQMEVKRLSRAQFGNLERATSIPNINWQTPLLLTHLLGVPMKSPNAEEKYRQFTRRFAHLTLLGADYEQRPALAPNERGPIGSFPLAEYFASLRSLTLLAFGPLTLGVLLRKCSRLLRLRQLTFTWSEVPCRLVGPENRAQLDEQQFLPPFELVKELTLIYMNSISGHDALTGLFNRWIAPAFPQLSSFVLNVIGDYQCSLCPVKKEVHPTSPKPTLCKRQLIASLAGQFPVLKSFKMMNQWKEEEIIEDDKGESTRTRTQYDYIEITDL